MIKGRWLPSGWGVAGLALNGQSGSSMVRILSTSEVRCVAGVTIRWSAGKACGVALGTGRGSMNTG